MSTPKMSREDASTASEAWRPVTWGRTDAPVVVICDPSTLDAWNAGRPIDREHVRLFGNRANRYDLKGEDFLFVGLCPPMPRQYQNSAKLKWQHASEHVAELIEYVRGLEPRCVVTFGELATRAGMGRSVKITKARGVPARGVFGDVPVFPMLSPAFVLRVPDHDTTLSADLNTLSRLKAADWSTEAISGAEKRYEWRTDIGDVVDALLHRAWEGERPVIALDTETTSLNPREAEVLCVQITPEPGVAYVCPVDTDYYPDLSLRCRHKLLNQLRSILEDPRIIKLGHNSKYDHHVLHFNLQINVKGWGADTMIMAFQVDENLIDKGLDNCIRVFVPEMSGYNDWFDTEYSKTDMRSVPHDAMLHYAGGDTDATFRLWRALSPMLDQDPDQTNLFRRVQMPAWIAFGEVVERAGVLVDQEELRRFGEEVSAWTEAQREHLLDLIPRSVKRQTLRAGKSMSFSRPDFVREVLFGENGFGLEPVRFTKSTAELDPEDRLPSTSGKQHLIYFANREDDAGQFCSGLMAYQKAAKLASTYIGVEENDKGEPTGFWRYIQADGAVYPTYWLSRTNTGRSASSDPNGQNWPKRGAWAKSFGKIMRARPGNVLFAADLSQIELRIMAWMASDPEMLAVYQRGGDLHTATACAVRFRDDVLRHGLLWTLEHRWTQLSADERKDFRRSAKVINFGFLYGMSANGFKGYAKTEFNEDYTQEQANEFSKTFFSTYSGLHPYHEAVKEFAREHGYVRALHGAIRRLPSVWSNDPAIVAMAERQAINAPVQRFGSDLGIIAMVRFTAQLLNAGIDPREARLCAFIHDQLVGECREDLAPEMLATLKWTMETPPLQRWFDITPPLPILSEVERGDNFGEMEELDGFEGGMPSWWNVDEDAVIERQLHVHMTD